MAGAIAVGLLLGGGTVSVDATAAAARAGRSGSQAKARPRKSTADAARAAQRIVRSIDRLRRQGFQVRLRASSGDTDCVAHSYGQVRLFFRTHPCVSMHRASLEITAKGTRTVLVAIASVAPGPIGRRLTEIVTNAVG